MKDILRVKNLVVEKNTASGLEKVIKDINIEIKEGCINALVGESGSGKTVTSLAMSGLSFIKPGITEGRGFFKNDLLYSIEKSKKSDDKYIRFHQKVRNIRGKEMVYLSQEPRASIDPMFTIGYQIKESIKRTQGSAISTKQLVEETLVQLHLEPKRIINSYSYQLSGGMCQLAAIAIALGANPSLLIADEPTTFLDARSQESVLSLLYELNQKKQLTILLITHNMHIVEKLAVYVMIMNKGEIVDKGFKDDLLKPDRKLHPYTSSLLKNLRDEMT